MLTAIAILLLPISILAAIILGFLTIAVLMSLKG